MNALRVLHVDDSESNRYRRDHVLRRGGFEVVSVNTARTALERVGDGRFDLGLLDVRLPDGDGFELTRQIRTLAGDAGLEIGIILVSAYFTESDYRVRGLDAGADAYLIEPVTDAELLATMRSVARTKLALRAARDQQQLLDAVFDHVPDGITYATPPDVTIQRVSRYGQQLTGRRREELEGITADKHPDRWGICRGDGVTPAHGDELPLTRATRHGEIVNDEEWVLVRPDGTRVVLLCNAAPVQNTRGETIGGVIAWRDITDRRRLEDDLRAANHAKDDFLAGVAHELRQPLSAAVAAVSVMEARQEEAAGQHARGVLDRQLQQMSRLIDDLLDASRLTRGLVTLHRQVIDIRSIVQEASEVVRPLLDRSRHDYQVLLPEDPVFVSADAMRLQQVFVNLLGNAARYTDTGGRIELRVESVADTVRIVVSDNGRGIPKDAQHRIFDLFTRATDRAGGLGIGLTIVRRLVELHDGAIDVQSEGEGQGSQFVVTLPAAANPASAPASRATD
jgi:signal transduction histidine kinase